MKRFVRWLLGISLPEPIEFEATRIRLGAHDVLVLMTESPLSAHQCELLREAWAAQVGIKPVVMAGMKFRLAVIEGRGVLLRIEETA